MSHELSKPKQYTFLYIALTLASMIFGLQPSQLRAQEPADFVWSPATTVTEGADKCFFRKRFTLINPEQAELLVATTGAYRTYLNGRLVHSANSSEKFQSIAISDFVFPGINLIAVEVDSQAAANGLALKIRVKERGEARWRAMTADETWLTHNSKFDGWERNSFRELSWLPAARADLAHVSKEQNVTDKNDSVVPVVTRESMLGKNESKSPTTNTTSKPQTPVDTSKSASGLFGDRTKGETKLKSAQADLKSDTPPTSIETASAANEKSENGEKTGGWFQLSKSKSVKETGVTKQVSDFTMQDREVPVVTSAQAKQELAHADPGPEPVESVTTVFEVNSEFNVDPIMSGEETGSVIAMTFDEFGRMIFSQEGGHVMIADLSINYGEPRVATLCDQVENCQGLLCVNGQLYVTGNGPDGLGLYCLERIDNRSTTMTVKRTLLTFTGEVGEHGPHGLTLGPDGRIYCVVGNASSVKNKTISSPYRFPYETDLAPRYEDPAGHASGIKSPGGTVVRVDLEGTSVQIMAGGIRNAYDLVFNTDGDLFVHDSDMESDLGLPWYRPTALTHVVAGSDLGWRSGWSKYPYYYSDVTPPLAQTGRGSPTGAVCYEHLQFPTRYHGALFLADWSEGRILAVTAERKGASYVAQTETFLAGKPLNVTDIEVGEDGALYFSTGGRGTSGGIYRVAWKGSVPDSIVEFEDDLTRLTRNPQPNSAWARQNMALIMSQPSVDWKKELQLAAKETSNSDAIRTRALTNLFLFGLLNDESFARTMAADSSELVRGKIAELCATLPKMAGVSIDLLKDASPYVQRKAVEGLLISNVKMPVELGVRLCGNENEPALMQLGCRILEQHSPDSWRSLVLNSSNKRECLVGSIALLKAEPSKENAYAVLAKNSELMADYLNDRDFMDLIRVSEMALSLAKIEQNKIGGFTERIAQEFPTKDPLLNRELIKVITYLKPASLPQSVVDYLRDSTDDEETKTLVAMHMATLGKDSTDELRLAVIESLSQTIEKNPGGGFQHYLARCIRESAEGLSVASVKTVIANGER